MDTVIVKVGGGGEATTRPLSAREVEKRQEVETAALAQQAAARERQALRATIEAAQAAEVLKVSPDVVRALRLESALRTLGRGQMPDAQLLATLGLS